MTRACQNHRTGFAALAAALWIVLAGASSATAQLPRLVDVRPESGIDFEHQYGDGEALYISESGGSGGAWFDFDIDGALDLLLINAFPDFSEDPHGAPAAAAAAGHYDWGGHLLLRASSNRYTPVEKAGGMDDLVWGSGAAVADVDNDGFPDVFISAIGPDWFYRNNGDGTFSKQPSGLESDTWSTTATFNDWDGDGFLDLYVTKYVNFYAEHIPVPGDGSCFYRGIEVFCGPEGLVGERDVFYRNHGDGSFSPWLQEVVDPEETYGFAAISVDCDNDQRQEVYVANDSNINLLYRWADQNEAEDWALFGGAGYSVDGREQAGMGATAADVDGDGLTDIFVTNFQNDYNTLYRNRGHCTFTDEATSYGLAAGSFPFMGWAPMFFDVDGDGDQDLYIANGHIHPQMEYAGLETFDQRNLLYINQLETGAPGFVEVGEDAGAGMSIISPSRAVMRGDYDNDGDADLLVTTINDQPILLRNEGPIQNPALLLTLVGRDSSRSPYGARVVVTSGGMVQHVELRDSDGYAVSNDPRVLTHLPGGIADRVEITWPSGRVSTLSDVEPAWLVIDEIRGEIARTALVSTVEAEDNDER
jgi:hypothetical protein